VIEGLRLLPWLQETTRRDPNGTRHLTDCDYCMRHLPRDTRIELGCGFEPRSDYACPPIPVGYEPGEATVEHPRGPSAPTVCPGYSTRLPEVIEVTRAYQHWKERTLRDRYGAIHDHLWLSLEVLGAEVSACESWIMRNPRKDGA